MKMGLSIALFSVPPVGQPWLDERFRRSWHRLTCLVMFLGFLALALTGELSVIAMGLFLAAWIIAVIRAPAPRWWRTWMAYLAVWLVLGVIGLLALSLNFNSLFYLLLFLGAFKCLMLRQPVDHLHANLIAFFMLLACTIITSSMLYLLLMLAFVVLTILDLICYAMAREAIQSQTRVQPRGRRPLHRAIQWQTFFSRLFWCSILLACFGVVLAYLMFIMIPHNAARLGPSSHRPGDGAGSAQSGFSEDLDLAAINGVNLDNTEVMLVKTRWEDGDARPRPDYLRLRGSVLGQFNTTGWTPVTSTRNMHFNELKQVDWPPEIAAAGPVLVQHMTLLNNDLKRVFGQTAPRRFDLVAMAGLEWRLNWQARALDLAAQSPYSGLSYRVESVVPQEGGLQLRRLAEALKDEAGEESESFIELADADWQRLNETIAGGATGLVSDPQLQLPPDERLQHLQLPPLPFLDQVRQLSQRYAPSGSIPLRILRLYFLLQTNYEYSLVPDTPKGMHPIEAFLFHTNKGHCEYFASALVLMLRSMEIPARIATGFYTTEYDSNNDSFIVRQSDAHAWVEVWLDGLGWLTLDPTPPDLRGRAIYASYQPPFWSSLRDRMAFLWQNYVLDYSYSQQLQILAMVRAHPIFQNLRGWIGRTRHLIRGVADGLTGASPQVRQQLIRGGGLGLMLGLLLSIAWWGWRRRRVRRAAMGYSVSPVAFMNQTLAQLERLGWKRAPHQTPAEFLEGVERQTQGRWALVELLPIYHAARFGQTPLTPQTHARAIAALRRMQS